MTLISIAQEGARLAKKATNDVAWKVDGQSVVAYGRGVIVPCCPSPRVGGTMEFLDNLALIAHAGTHYAALCRAVIDAEAREEHLIRCLRHALSRNHAHSDGCDGCIEIDAALSPEHRK